ncbi:hypothetical protein I7I50_04597 [Histoplasma capsulatum G186AR]|uniref:Protein kinase domain-containing protein n=1 Tax=Ajellomyces capsulatus TaxID=5037 RepID=A0A8H7YM64_AJECA|nr:hypothetical protein I7I52_05506 [Histoplasma capsulatum]QSS75459.1 hypothetical protein I7I50_04597 [Histoplasma capsulatum G186AR]
MTSTDRPCTAFPGRLCFPDTSTLSEPIAESHTPGAQKRKLWKPPPLPLPVNHPNDENGNKRFSAEFCQQGSPWGKYQRFTREGQSKTLYLASEHSAACTVVAIKEYKLSEPNTIQNLLKTSHSNLVNLKSAYVNKSVVFFVYEQMHLSLDKIHSCIVLKEAHIAAVCKEILQGLSYVHKELHITHGNITCRNIFLSFTGLIKIGKSVSCSMLLPQLPD